MGHLGDVVHPRVYNYTCAQQLAFVVAWFADSYNQPYIMSFMSCGVLKVGM